MDLHPLARVPSRPSFSRPPAFARSAYPQAVAFVRPAAPPAQERWPILPDQRPANQDYRLGVQERRPGPSRRLGGGGGIGGGGGFGAARDNWRRRRARPVATDSKPYARMVQAAGFPGYTQPQDLIHAFKEFGPATVERIIGNTAALLFNTPEEAEAAIRASTTVCLYGEFLSVQPYTKALEHQRVSRNHRGDADKGRPKAPTVDPTSIPFEGDFEAQLNALLAAVRLAPRELQQLAGLYRDLEAALKPAWPGCVTIPFGSVTTGLGVKASDADCFVLLPGGTSGAGRESRAAAVPRARRLLAQQPQIFSSLIAIPNANTPIVKFFHLPTNTHCDVSFKTLLGVQNSKLINFLLCSDPRLLPLAVVIKYWAAVHELSGTGKLTNYALTMLLIFYLQQPTPILPPVAWLQQDRATEFIVDGWNTGFMDEREHFPPTQNDTSLADLIGGFFQFYSQFNFAELVVCPYLGHTVKKEAFKDLNQLPAEFERYKTNVTAGVVLAMRSNTPLCVQDPFEQCHNVASAVTTRLANEIRTYFKFAAETYEKDKHNDCKNFLGRILLEKPKLPRVKGKNEFRVSVYANTLANIAAEDWRSVAKEVVHNIFHTILKLDLQPNRDASDTDVIPETPQKNREKVKFTAVITRAIWKRKQFSKLYSAMKLRFLDRERKITEEIMATDNNVINIPLQLTVTYVNHPRTVMLTARPVAGDLQTFKEFGKFFQSVMLHWFLVLSRPYCERQEKPKAQAAATTHNPINGMSQFEVVSPQTAQISDSDSDSSESTEDERTPPDAQTDSADPDTSKTPSDSEKSPSDAEKENIEETQNVGDRINATADKPQNDVRKNRKVKNKNGFKSDSAKKRENARGQEKSGKCPDSATIENGKLP